MRTRRIPKHSKPGYRLAWRTKDSDVMDAVLELAFQYAPNKYSQEDVGKYIIEQFSKLRPGTGWWPVGLMYNRVCRAMGIGPQGGKGEGEQPWIKTAVRAKACVKLPAWTIRHR